MGLFARISSATAPGNAHLAGIGLMLAAMALFSFGDALGKLVVASYSIGQLLLLRACAGLIVLSPLIWRQRAEFLRLPRPWLQLARTIIATLEVATFFLATAYLPLADVITFYLASSLFVTVGSALFLREQVDAPRWIAIVVGFVGVLVALQPSAQTMTWPALIALCASVFFAGLLLITRSLRGTPDMVLASQQFIGTLALGAVLIPSAPAGWITPDLFDSALFAIAGAVSALGLLCVNRSLRLAPASVVVPYQYTMIVWGVVFGYLVFGDWPSPAMLIGAAIIIGAGFYILLRERRGAAPGERAPGA
ncbi:drug/metabolite transporter (DMT)-like permease [Rhodopseudomonas rhenobacensis]|uniref:Drug/metabolite transporter (DMT)-like permease n=1 Tax=Rhodopseudomonas rhenobacensis TaxID=87461 RepID=A0A7W8DX87_9BRAD|nr:DMT family transporter [Rhodopseudomonas rhenobacensis]MBB5045497.1 drug/metabolite transporter (DMT)-like permease [Rhodopseudomonas rhenobacensis]